MPKTTITILRHTALLLALLIGFIELSAYGLQNGEENTTEYAVKAAFLLKFGGFVDWPPNTFPDPDTPFVIGVLGEDPFGPVFEQVIGTNKVQGRTALLKRFSKINQVSGVNVLYISPSERDNLPAIRTALDGKSILTVSDTGMPGVIINFVVDGGRLRFDIDLRQAEHDGLKISSKLLAVARTVKAA